MSEEKTKCNENGGGGRTKIAAVTIAGVIVAAISRGIHTGIEGSVHISYHLDARKIQQQQSRAEQSSAMLSIDESPLISRQPMCLTVSLEGSSVSSSVSICTPGALKMRASSSCKRDVWSRYSRKALLSCDEGSDHQRVVTICESSAVL